MRPEENKSREAIDRRVLEARIVYCIIVAGKSADFADQVTFKLWAHTLPGESPFEMFRRLGDKAAITALLWEVKSGRYTSLARSFWELANSDIDLATCEPEDLERFPGIGRKTSRFFILWTRPGAMYAALDVHILQWLREQGYECPNRYPKTETAYHRLEMAFIAEAKKRNMTPRELDWLIWSNSAKSRGFVQTEH